MPKAGETPEMGANPLLGFGRVYARPEVARDRRPRGSAGCSTSRATPSSSSTSWLQGPGHHALGRGRRHAREHLALRRGQDDGPDGGVPPVRLAARLSRPYESYMGCLTVPRRVAEAAERALAPARLPDAARAGGARRSRRPTPASAARTSTSGRCGGKSRVGRLGRAVGGVDGARRPPRRGRLEGPVGPRGVHRLGDLRADLPRRELEGRGGSHARLPLRRLRRHGRGDAGGQPRPRCSTSTPRWRSSRPPSSCPCERRGPADAARPRRAGLRAERLRGAAAGGTSTRARSRRTRRRSARRRPPTSRRAGRVLQARRLPAREELAGAGERPATSATTRTPARRASRASATASTGSPRGSPRARPRAAITFTFRLMEPLETTRHVFSPLLVRFISGVDHTHAPGEDLRLGAHPQRAADDVLPGPRARRRDDPASTSTGIDEKVLPREKQETIRKVLEWYKANHPVWFDWLEVAGVSTPRI